MHVNSSIFLTFIALVMIGRLTSSVVSSSPRFRAMRSIRLSSYVASDSCAVDVTALKTSTYNGDLLVVPFFKGKDAPKEELALSAYLKAMIPEVLPAMKTLIANILDEKVFKADPASKQVIRIAGNKGDGPRFIALVGLSASTESVEVPCKLQLGHTIAALAKEVNAVNVGVTLPNSMFTGGVQQVVLGVHDASYDDNRFKKAPEEGFKLSPLKSLQLLSCSQAVVDEIGAQHRSADMIASGVKFAKDLVGVW